jgi:hypothetical protein
MHKHIPVLDVEIDEYDKAIQMVGTIYNEKHLPIGVTGKNTVERGLLNEWWTGRKIPGSRPGLEEALERLNVRTEKDLVLKGFGLSLSDQYWVCPQGANLKWEEINFFDHDFSLDVGNVFFENQSKKSQKKMDLLSPDNTSDGWLKKKWVIQGGKRILVKAGSAPYYQEPVNETIAASIAKRLGIPHVAYTLIMDGDQPLSVCENMIDSNTELVSAWSIMKTEPVRNDRSKYQHCIASHEKTGIKNIRPYLEKMIVFDYLIVNTDRHFNNFGSIRNAESLEWDGPSPLFDSGTSLWHDQDVDRINSLQKIESKPFRNNHSDQIKLVPNFDCINLDALKGVDEEFAELLRKTGHIKKERINALRGALKTRVTLLERIMNDKTQKKRISPDDGYGR